MTQNLEPGDRIFLYSMENEMIDIGTKGTVKNITFDPFEEDNQIISVKWDNGRTLNLMSKYDNYKKIANTKINESFEEFRKKANSGERNPNFIKNFDIQAIESYLEDLKKSEIVNFLYASPYLYSGEKFIIDKHGSAYDREDIDNEQFDAYERVLANAESIRKKMIEGTYKNIKGLKQDFDISDLDKEVKKHAVRILNYYVLFR